ncbi:MAG: hypothetical protein Q7T69_14060 [Rhodoferax sp.]|nr:hypothetical protein [Rhodoferax sp.]
MKMKLAWVLLLPLALVACGGGGGEPSPAPAPPPVTVFPIDSVVTKLAIAGGTFSGTNVDSKGVQTQMVVTYVPGATGWFSRNQTLTTNGAATTTRYSVNFSRADTLFKVVGWIDNTQDTASILAGNSTPLPATGNVGTSGTVFTGSLYIQDNGINMGDIGLTHGLRYSWSLTAATDATADLCLSSWEIADFVSNLTMDCFRIDAIGTISGFKSTLGVHAKSIDYQTVYQ